MKYVSSFVHVRNKANNTVAIDVTKIASIEGKADEHDCIVLMQGCTTLYQLTLNRDKFINMVEDKRRELHEASTAGQLTAERLLSIMAIINTPQPQGINILDLVDPTQSQPA